MFDLVFIASLLEILWLNQFTFGGMELTIEHTF